MTFVEIWIGLKLKRTKTKHKDVDWKALVPSAIYFTELLNNCGNIFLFVHNEL